MTKMEDKLTIFGGDPELLKTVKVRFRGKVYWLMEQNPFLPPGRTLGYLHHFDEHGEILLEHCLDESFAHVRPHGINRHGVIIGQPDELEIVK
jgi:hypothetical protein